MNGRCFRIILAIWILVAVPQVFSDSFPSHPTVTEMEATVMLGTECVRGVNERCQATQYATNPVQYQIGPPFVKTNDVGWYLDQGLMGALASNIMSLVPYYVDTNSVYDGTANIVMLTFTGLLASLHLGDGTNFIATPCWTNNV